MFKKKLYVKNLEKSALTLKKHKMRNDFAYNYFYEHFLIRIYSASATPIFTSAEISQGHSFSSNMGSLLNCKTLLQIGPVS
jgi:hypothetical protein